jgi:ABC-type branched-subunit amino acid transport system ATPase component
VSDSPVNNEGEVCTASDASFFSVRNLGRRFGQLAALDDLSFELKRNEIFGIAGPNGAGKSTLLNVGSGHLKSPSIVVECAHGRELARFAGSLRVEF